MGGAAGHVARPEVLGGTARVSTGKLQLVRRRLEQQRCRLEPDLTLVVGHGRVFAVA